jgi:serine/threonine protein phosphatase PrpC
MAASPSASDTAATAQEQPSAPPAKRQCRLYSRLSLYSLVWLAVLILSVHQGVSCFASSLLLPFVHWTPRDVAFDADMVDALIVMQSIQSPQSAYRKLAMETLQTVGSRDQVAVTLMGYKGGLLQDQVNQDRGIAVRINQTDWLHASWDGHGSTGHNVSGYCQEEIPKRLIDALSALPADHSTQDVVDIMMKLYTAVEDDLPDEIAQEGGATATLVLQYRGHFYSCNAGDSQSWLAASWGNETRVLYKTRLDKPDDPEEKARVLKAGGIVTDRSAEDDARVYYKHANGRDYGLAMTRVIGDRGATAVISTPTVQVWSLADLYEYARGQFCAKSDAGKDAPSNPQEMEVQADGSTTTASSAAKEADCQCRIDDINLFAMSASDGVIDYMSLEEVASMLAPSLWNKTGHPVVAASNVLHESGQRWYRDFGGRYRDDMVLVVSKLGRPSSGGDSDSQMTGAVPETSSTTTAQ